MIKFLDLKKVNAQEDDMQQTLYAKYAPYDLSDEVQKEILTEGFYKDIDDLTPREQKVLSLRFGLDGGEPMHMEEVAKEYNTTRERIRQIEAKALRKLRHPSRTHSSRPLLDMYA